MFTDPEYLLSGPALCRSVRDKQHFGALHILKPNESEKFRLQAEETFNLRFKDF